MIDQKHIVEMAKDTLVTRGAHIPQFVMELPDGNLIMALAPFSNDEEKEMTQKMARQLVIKHDIQEYCFISEGWMVKQELDKIDETPYIRPKQHRDRLEVLNIGFHFKNGKSKTYIYPFKRSESGKIIFTDEMITESDNVCSTFDLFRDEREMDIFNSGMVDGKNKAFVDRLLKEAKEKFKDKFMEALKSKNPDELLKVSKEVHDFFEAEKKKIDQITLEDAEKVDEELAELGE